MPVDPIYALLQSITRGAGLGSLRQMREWNVPTVTTAARMNLTNSEAGYHAANLRAPGLGVLYNSGAGTTAFPFTANVSVINANGLSTDIVTGS
jgi:hypothetical protein